MQSNDQRMAYMDFETGDTPKAKKGLGIHWLTTLSLDAPLVALAWQELFASAFRSPLEIHHRILVFACVWLGYVSDRWLDARRMSRLVTHRHAYHNRFKWAIAALWTIVLALSIRYASDTLSQALLSRGVLLAVISLLLTCLIQTSKPGNVRTILKSTITAFLVASSSLIFSLPADAPFNAEAISPAIATIMLFAFNCLLIHGWDNEIDRAQEPASGKRASLQTRYIACGAFASSIICVIENPVFGITVFVSLILLLALESTTTRMHPETRRTLADIALLTPFASLLLQ